VQQFTVPQFIDVEDKIIGPITTRQFVIILAGSIFIAIFYKIFDFSLFIFASVLAFIFSMIFAFVKINGRPFHFFILNFVQTLKRANLRIWINNANFELATETEAPKIEKPINTKTMTPQSSRLDELSLVVDTQGVYKGDDKY